LVDTVLTTRVPRLSATRKEKKRSTSLTILERRRACRRKGPSLGGHRWPPASCHRARQLRETRGDWGVHRWPRSDAGLFWGKSRTESDVPFFLSIGFFDVRNRRLFFYVPQFGTIMSSSNFIYLLD
jgi:hypothetical protein